MTSMAIFLIILLSGLTSAIAAASTVLELARGNPDVAAGSAALMVTSGIVVLLQCTRMIARELERRSSEAVREGEEDMAR